MRHWIYYLVNIVKYIVSLMGMGLGITVIRLHAQDTGADFFYRCFGLGLILIFYNLYKEDFIQFFR